MTSDFIAGNDIVRNMVVRSFNDQRLHHALLFHGPSGIGKYSFALRISRMLNCLTGLAGCTCSSCVRASLPFPFHPDLKLFTEYETPIYLSMQSLWETFRAEAPQTRSTFDSDSDLKDFQRILESLKEDGFVKKSQVCRNANPPVEVLAFNGTKPLSASYLEKISDRPFSYWCVKKMVTFLESGTYRGSIKIEQIRQLQRDLQFHPFEGRYKIAIIDHSDRMLAAAQNSLLKTLEEPPSQSILILLTSNLSALLPTIRSRCQILPFHPLSQETLRDVLIQKFGYLEPIAEEISQKSEGRVSRALETDWALLKTRHDELERIFREEINDTIASRAVRLVNALIREKDDSPMEDTLMDLIQWLHSQLRHILASDSPVESHILSEEAIISMVDGISDILNHRVFHPDIRLHLETLMIRILSEHLSGRSRENG